MNEELGKETLLDHARSPYHHGSLQSPTYTGRFDNPVCGDVSRIALRVSEAGEIEEASYESEGCMINRAGGSILVEFLEGKTLNQARDLSDKDVLELLNAILTPRRQICFLITFFALQNALSCRNPTVGERL